MKKILAVDGNSIINRAYYGIRILTNKDGLPTNAVYGMTNILSRQLDALKPDYAAVAFDLKAPTFRHKKYSEYKAGRKAMPEELAVQFPYAKKICRAMGFTVLEKEGYEADDILGTLAAFAEQNECEAYILTGDKDSLQLISSDGRIKVLLAGNSDTSMFDCEAFIEKYGVKPSQFVDVKALMGDSSDNIPGVPGIGEKTALKLISEHGTLDGVYNDLQDSGLTPSVKAKLEAGRDSAYMSRELATICREVPLSETLSELCYKGFDRPTVKELFTELGFFTLIKKYALDTVALPSQKEEDYNAYEKGNDSEVSITDVDMDMLGKIFEKKEFALYYSTDVTTLYLSDGERVFRLHGEDIWNVPAMAERAGVKIICYNCKNLYEQLGKNGVYFRNIYHDVMLGAYVLNSGSNSFELEKLILNYLGISDSDIGEEKYALYIYHLFKKLDATIKEQNAERLLYEIEMPLSGVLADMETAGFRIDKDGLVKYGDQLDIVARELESRIYFSAGCEFNINSPKQLGEILFGKLMLPAKKKTKTGYSTNAEILEKLRPYHPIIDDILDYRKVTKLKSTYVEGLSKVADKEGRVHTCFKQTGTVTGRLSSSEPNLQNIPIRTELGRELRRFFIPKNKDYVLVDADYSQIELRLLAAISGDETMINAFKNGEDIHTSTASAVFGVPADKVTLELRKRAKAVNFGIVYGIGEFSLSEDLGISRAQAKQYIESYLSGFPLVDKYLKDIVKNAYEHGFVTTLFGRRRYIPELAGQNKNLKNFGERVAMNSPIQGSAADIIKIAMINVARELKKSEIDARLILQVHDELILEAHRDSADEAVKILKSCMESAVSLCVPLTADTTVGKTWYDNK